MSTAILVMGAETEYAMSCVSSLGFALDCRACAPRLVQQLSVLEPCLADGHAGVFLANGARCYVDCGYHPEYSTPECTDPRELVRHVKAGESLLYEATRVLERTGFALKIMLFRNNVDYSGAGTTWGAHESYMCRMIDDHLPLVRNLVPHLVSRIVYAGAGGFDPASCGLRFMVSPRACYFEQVVSGDSTASRGIFHTKNEAHAGKHARRLHLLCGESLGSATASVLKFGTTALIVALAEKGLNPGRGLDLRDPVAAYRQIAGDVELAQPIMLTDGRQMTALQIQRRYLEEVSRYVGDAFMPSWAEEIVKIWKDALDALDRGFQAVARKLDWAMRYALFLDRVVRAGLDERRLRIWTEIFETLGKAARQAGSPLSDISDIESLIDPRGPVPGAFRKATKTIQKHGFSWEDGREFLRLRERLLEIDLRFGQLGDEGLFAVLDLGGHLAHGTPGVDRIAEAMRMPPADTRASLRGQFVRQHSLADKGAIVCGWSAIWNRRTGRVLDMSDPLQRGDVWRSMTPEEATGLKASFTGPVGDALGA